jgi:hypothetical protein
MRKEKESGRKGGCVADYKQKRRGATLELASLP